MKKVTYLFGAGASAQSLPVIIDIPDRLNHFTNFILEHRIGTHEKFDGLGISPTVFDIEEELMNECKDLETKVRMHASIDTYAKKLRITAVNKGENLKRYRSLKAILSGFFIYEQLSKNIDLRYDSFFASLLKDSPNSFPENVRVVSWNYDFQFEKAYSAFSGNDSLHHNQILLNIFPSDLRLGDYKEQFSIFKINGTTGFYNREFFSNEIYYDNLNTLDSSELVKKILWHYAASIYNPKMVRTLLSFAWEREWEESTKELIKMTQAAIERTDVLVTIGYSFPFFNRDLDRELINSMAMGGSLKKIYVQDKTPHKIIEKISSVLPEEHKIKLIPIDAVDQFYLPPEL